MMKNETTEATDLLSNLNEAQRGAVEYCSGPSLVIAGAGSGKTRVLTYKIAYLLQHGMMPWNIMALTFTNKAAEEMKIRIGQLVGEEQSRYLWMGTFHSIFLRILHYEHETVGFAPNFTIYDASDSASLLKKIIKEMGLDEKVYKPSNVMARISAAKNRLITAQVYNSNPDNRSYDAQSNMPHIGEVYATYSQRLRQSNVMDFDDILLYTYILFDTNNDIRQKYAERLEYVLVDEYQDTNYAQHLIVWQLTQEKKQVCVVGDDAQSIYSFRGANIDNILKFKEFFPQMRLFKLEQNYRSTQTIVNAANSLIHHNKAQIPKTVFSHLDRGELLQVCQAFSDVEEGNIVLRKIKLLQRQEHLEYRDFSILYRTNAQSRIFEENLRKEGIPYRIVGGLSFYQRKEIKDIVAYMRLAVNLDDEEAFRRVVNYPRRGIGDTTVTLLTAVANEHRVSLWTVASRPVECGVALSNAPVKKLQGFCTLMHDFHKQAQTEDAYTVAKTIIGQSGIYNEILLDNTPEGLARRENVDELVSGLNEFVTSRREEGNSAVSLADYLSEISLLSDIDQGDSTNDNRVQLMTVHSAKGLEFNTVFVVGMEENLFPNQMAMGSIRQLEEERRLFYVAITRAKRHCILTYADCRYRFGKMEFANPSRFLNDIDAQYLNKSGMRQNTKNRSYGGLSFGSFRSSTSTTHSSNPITRTTIPSTTIPTNSLSAKTQHTMRHSFNVGDNVIHKRFGFGTVISIEGIGADEKAMVRFENVGIKQLLLKFADLQLRD